MRRVRKRGEDVRTFILEHVASHPSDIVRTTAQRFGISRQASHKHVARLIDDGFLVVTGATKSRQYAIAVFERWEKSYALAGLEEDRVWTDDIEAQLGALPENALAIWRYGFTEMLNNAIDHSEGSNVTVLVAKTAKGCQVMITDDGIGIFHKIKQAFKLADERHAVLELAKGKLTTDPKRHTGQGIFFTSRAFNRYTILSQGVYFDHELDSEHDIIGNIGAHTGTLVRMELKNHTSRSMKKIFDQYSSDDEEYRFSKTVVPVKLAQYGEDQLVSRSQAKRVMARVDKFEIVLLDFDGVKSVGQAFADEIFRVFTREHPSIELVPMRANSEVKRMIARAQSHDA